MTVRSTALFGLAVLLLPCGAVLPAGATAVTVGANYQEGSIRQSRVPPGAQPCGGVQVCFVIFNVVPAGKQLMITDVSCRIFDGSTNELTFVSLMTLTASNSSTDRESNMIPVRTHTPPGTGYAAAGQVRHLVKAGERPVVRFSFGSVLGGPQLNCGISGTLGNPPQ